MPDLLTETSTGSPLIKPIQRRDVLKGAGGPLFAAAGSDTREEVLRAMEQNKAGEAWLAIMLEYLLEAMLADPACGGNPGGIGWHWLGHRHGFPTPTADKLWYKL